MKTKHASLFKTFIVVSAASLAFLPQASSSTTNSQITTILSDAEAATLFGACGDGTNISQIVCGSGAQAGNCDCDLAMGGSTCTGSQPQKTACSKVNQVRATGSCGDLVDEADNCTASRTTYSCKTAGTSCNFFDSGCQNPGTSESCSGFTSKTVSGC